MSDADGNETPQTEQTAAEQAPRRTARRSRRATRPAGTPDAPTLDVLAELGLDAATEATTPDQQRDDEPVEATDDPPAEPEAAVEPEDETAVEPEDGDAVDADGSAEDEPTEESADEAAEASEDDSPRLPATALLFQAPDLTPRRRRRASAPAGPPAEADEPVEPESATTSAEGDGDSEPEAPSRSRRGRGRGRGGKKSKADGDAGGQGGDAPAESDPAEDDRAEDPTDETEASSEAPESEDDGGDAPRRRRRRGGRGRRKAKAEDDGDDSEADAADDGGEDATSSERETDEESEGSEGGGSRRRRRRRSRSGRDEGARARDEVTALKGSTRLEAKRQRRREGRDANRRRAIITEAEFLARRESVDRAMVVREREGRTQIAVLEDDVLVEHFVARKTQTSMVGNVYLGRVQNVLPSMEAAFVDLGRGRNAVLYAGEVNWDAAGLEGQPRRIEQALSSGDSVLVQVTKDPIGHKGARLTSQITLAGRYLVLVPSGAMTGISRKLPDTERNRLKKLLKEIVPEGSGVIVRTAAEGASEEELRRDVERLTKAWEDIDKKVKKSSTTAPVLLKGEPELATRVVRDVFNEDFRSLTVQGDEAWKTISEYVSSVAPDLAERLHHWTDATDVFAAHRIDEQLAKGMDRKVWLPSGGSLIIDRTEAMTVVDVNTGKFTGSGGTLEETVTRNNLEAAEEIVRQLRLRDIGGIIVVDFIDMVLESNRDLVLRRLVECLGRDRTRHQVAEVTSLGLVQMTRKRVGQGLVEAFSTTCEHCHGRGFVLHEEPVESGSSSSADDEESPRSGRGGRGRGRRSGSGSGSGSGATTSQPAEPAGDPEQRAEVRAKLAAIAAAAAHAHDEHHEPVAVVGSPDAEEPLTEAAVPVAAIEIAGVAVDLPGDPIVGDAAPESVAVVVTEVTETIETLDVVAEPVPDTAVDEPAPETAETEPVAVTPEVEPVAEETPPTR